LKKIIKKTKQNFKNKISLQVGVVDGRIMNLSKQTRKGFDKKGMEMYISTNLSKFRTN
jgi:hypothetical protein